MGVCGGVFKSLITTKTTVPVRSPHHEGMVLIVLLIIAVLQKTCRSQSAEALLALEHPDQEWPRSSLGEECVFA